MKLYHGTSFENACQILSKEQWRPPAFFDDLEDKEIYTDRFLESYTLSKDIKQSATFFTTNVDTASNYAHQHTRPVILWWDCEDAKESGYYSFRYNDPIPTAQVKALIGVSPDVMYYGNLINAIFAKDYLNKYIVKSVMGGIMTAPSRKAMKDFLRAIITDLEES